MQEIELSVMSYSEPFQSDLRAALEEFEAQHGARVQIRSLDWETSWSELLKFTFDGRGPAVSEIGDTWVVSLATMNALRPFTERDVAAVGGRAAFLPAAWQSTLLPGDPTVWTMPWLAETRAIFYRRDLLQAAGVEETTAFATQAKLEETLERLQASGVAIPWVVPTRPTVNTFHNMTSWIWGAGGDYADEGRRQVTFAEEAARAGIRAYYSLHRFLAPEARDLDIADAEVLFAEGKAAATLSGPWIALSPYVPRVPGVTEHLGVALPPGVPCVLGSHLVVWKYVPPRQERLALELVRFLSSQRAQLMCSQQVGLLPVRLEALSSPPFSDQPVHQTLVRGLKSGRSFPVMRLWGLIEEQLTAVFGNLWARVLATPDPDLDALIRAELEPLAERLNRRLQ